MGDSINNEDAHASAISAPAPACLESGTSLCALIMGGLTLAIFWRRTCADCAPNSGSARRALAHECGINRTYLSAVERAEGNVSINKIARIAKGHRVEPWTRLRDN